MDEVKVDIDQKTAFGESALHRACYRNRIEILIELLAHNADMEIKENEFRHTVGWKLTPMYRAIDRNRNECIEILL